MTDVRLETEKMSNVWNYSPPPPPVSWPPKQPKLKMNTKSTSSFLLPRLDDMVLFKPITTPCDDRDDFKEPLSMEKTRTTTISQHLDRYNRWLAFAEASNSRKKVRSTAVDMQRAVHDLNLTIANMMIEIDQKILLLQDSTDAFVEAVQEGELWRSNGNLLDLSLEELDAALVKDPERNTNAQLERLIEIVRKGADPKELGGIPVRRRPGRLTAKLIRIIKEVHSSPGGTYEAFHLYVFVIAHVFHLRDLNVQFGSIGSDTDCRTAESLLLQIANAHRRKPLDGTRTEGKIYFDFSSAKRAIWNSIPNVCSTCGSCTSHASDQSLLDPFPSCRRASALNLIERLQIEAYGEIRSSVMLTLPSKLPKELCILVFEYAMVAEDIALDPRVFEPDGEGAESSSNRRFNWTAKAEYRCRESVNIE